MLLSLSVRNFILIDKLDIEFEHGLCTITGETGSGKSILLEAILFCLGAKSSTNVIKPNAETATVTAIFCPKTDLTDFLHEVGIPCCEELVIKSIQYNNRKKFFINDQLVTHKIVLSIAAFLYEIHGQNNQSLLLNTASHVDILDNYGNLLDLRASLSSQFKVWRELIRQADEAAHKRETIDREIDYLKFAISELSNLNIEQHDEENLALIRRKLQNHDKEIALINSAITQFESSEIVNNIAKIQRIINRSNSAEAEEFQLVSKNLDDAYSHSEEALSNLKLILNNARYLDYSLDEVEEKLFRIRNLARKYSVQPNELPKFLNDSEANLLALENKVISDQDLAANAEAAKVKYHLLALDLSAQRITAARNLETIVHQELAQLKMDKAVFKIDISSQDIKQATLKGMDYVRFVASTNPGQPLAPIDLIASGGELSRFMLAFKSALFDKTSISTVIFDEIDTGIGGAVAEAIGERLQKLSKAAQVIIITHQPQVAAKADQHILVHKTQSDNLTTVKVETLNKEAKIREIARMISGKVIADASLRAAKELLYSE